jgi:hypothetical protein
MAAAALVLDTWVFDGAEVDLLPPSNRDVDAFVLGLTWRDLI